MARTEVDVNLSSSSANVEVNTSSGANVTQSSTSVEVTSSRVTEASSILVGAQGPPGPSGGAGPSGTSGASGNIGPTGVSGASITGVSGSGTGVYFLLDNNTTIGAINIQGPSGADGSQGSQGDTGESGPSGATGLSGISGLTGPSGSAGASGPTGVSITGTIGTGTTSFFLLDNGTQIGPINIQGPSGASGNDGVQGDQGEQGEVGSQGDSGPTGTTGAHITGIIGTGSISYLLLSNGNQIGPVNVQGPSGATGASGISGLIGVSGMSGIKGEQGDAGETGPDGATGHFGGDSFAFAFGTDTSDSDPGNGKVKFDDSSYSAVSAIFIDDLDSEGDSITAWIDSLDDVLASRIRIFAKNDPSKWITFRVTASNTSKTGYTQLNVYYIAHSDSFNDNEPIVFSFSPAAKGDKGDTGSDGSTGSTGSTGAAGEVGATGTSITGTIGTGDTAFFLLDDGSQIGPVNIQGPSGSDGAQGEQGDQGDQGISGISGMVGQTGPSGADGESGISGATGPSGATGVSVTGIIGTGTTAYFLLGNGNQVGPVNIQGPSGSDGSAGSDGNQGISGISGMQGESGISGMQGIQGTQGSQGEVGTTGHYGGDSFQFDFDTDTADNDPGNGEIKFSNSTLDLVTAVYIDDLDSNGDSITLWVDSLDDVIYGRIRIFSKHDPSKWVVYRINDANTSKSGYTQLNVNYIASSDSFDSGETLVVTFSPAAKGPKGDTGHQGAGVTGVIGSGTGITFVISGGSEIGPINIQGPSGQDGASGISGISITGAIGTGENTYFLLSNTHQVGPVDVQGPSGATGVTGSSGDFGGNSFSFRYNSGWAAAQAEDKQTYAFKFIPNYSDQAGDTNGLNITAITGIQINAYNYQSGNVSGWLKNIGDYGKDSDRGVMKVFPRERTNINWAMFTITGASAYHWHHDGENSSIRIGLQAVDSANYYIDNNWYPNSGETVISIIHAGPSGNVGPQGEQGISGISGMQGEQGISGISGISGMGNTGPAGGTGVSVTGVIGTGETAFFLLGNGDQIGPVDIQGPSGASGATGTGLHVTGVIGTGDTTYFVLHGGTEIGPVNIQGPSGSDGAAGVSVTGASGASGDFGGDSFSFIFNTGWSSVGGVDPGAFNVRLLASTAVSPDPTEEDVTGMAISEKNYNDVLVQEWINDWYTYGSSTGAGHGRIKIFPRGRVNGAFACYRITGDLVNGGGTPQHFVIGLEYIYGTNGQLLGQNHGGETVVTFVGVGASGTAGAAGADGLGGGGDSVASPAYSFQNNDSSVSKAFQTGSHYLFQTYVNASDPYPRIVIGDFVDGATVDAGIYNNSNGPLGSGVLYVQGPIFTEQLMPVEPDGGSIGSGKAGLVDGHQWGTIATHSLQCDYIGPSDFNGNVICSGNLIPNSDGFSSLTLGNSSNYWEELYVNNSSIIMSGGNMTGFVSLGISDDHSLVLSEPKKVTGDSSKTGVILTGLNSQTFSQNFYISGLGAGSATEISTNNEGVLQVQTPGQTSPTFISTGESSTSITSETGYFDSTVVIGTQGEQTGQFVVGGFPDFQGPNIFEATDTGIGIMSGAIIIVPPDSSGEASVTQITSNIELGRVDTTTYVKGGLVECVEDLGKWTNTGYSPAILGSSTEKIMIPFTGCSMKKIVLEHHATGLYASGAVAGQSVTVMVGAARAGAYGLSVQGWQFVSGSPLSWLGAQPTSLEIGKTGFLSITAYGTGYKEHFATWSQTD